MVKAGGPWCRAEVAAIVKERTLQILGDVEYGEDRRFVEDLGVS